MGRSAATLAASRSDLLAVLRRSRSALAGVTVFSALVNVLALASSLYMLQLYDRVIPAHSLQTLMALTILMLGLFAALGLFEWVRTRVMSRLAMRLDRALRRRVFAIVLALPLCRREGGDGAHPIGALDQVRGFLSSAGPVALMDLPWMPFYLALVYLLHPWLGLLALAGALVLVGLTMLTEMRSRAPARSAAATAAQRRVFLEAGRRNAEVVRALGMSGRMSALWSQLTDGHLAHQLASSDIAGGYAAASRVMRLAIQSAVLGLGAYLVIIGEATGGVMIAASILSGRALAPVELAIANWRGFLTARQSFARLASFLVAHPERAAAMALPRPSHSLSVEGLWVAAPGGEQAILRNASFAVSSGAALGIIGPSASGKSTLARALVGAWSSLRGTVRLDAAALDQWSPEALGDHIGYLPQDIELFDGTVAANIARLAPEPSAEAVIAAARAADVHDMILRLPGGYETRIGEGGSALSAGQRQRIALARALYGDPFLVVLDEPNSNLDAAGDAALTRAILGARARGAVVVVIAHRPSALAGCDQVLVLAEGQVQAFGPKDEVLRTVLQPVAAPPQAPGRFKVVAEGAP